jgi:hypothetical protein
MFQTPQHGDVITVTTRTRNHYVNRTSDYNETTYENVQVQRPLSWLSSFEFCIAADGPESRTANIEVVERRDRAPAFDVLAMRYERAYTPSYDVPKFDTRVIHMKNVISINGVDVSNQDFSSKTVEVPSSKGGTYKVQVEGGIGTDCECTGFQFRRKCRHLKEAEEMV